MSSIDLLILLALSCFAVYKQTVVAKVNTSYTRFTMAAIYIVVGLAVGGINAPHHVGGWTLLVAGVALSAVVGVLRARHTRIWRHKGRIYRRGTVLTIALFVALIAVKYALGVLAYWQGINDGAGLGEVLVMIGIMIAVQADLLRRRAQTLAGRQEPAGSNITPVSHTISEQSPTKHSVDRD